MLSYFTLCRVKRLLTDCFVFLAVAVYCYWFFFHAGGVRWLR